MEEWKKNQNSYEKRGERKGIRNIQSKKKKESELEEKEEEDDQKKKI